MIHRPNEVELTDDSRESVSLLLRLRFPWLLGGLIVGGLMTLFISRFEAILSEHIALAFFIPFIVYMSDAVGTQTEAIYVRGLVLGKAKFSVYMAKEFLIGIALGLIFGSIVGLFAFFIFQEVEVAVTVGLAMAVSVAIAPVVAMIASQSIKKLHRDPALGAGPFATIVQDFLTVIIYFIVATLVLFNGV